MAGILKCKTFFQKMHLFLITLKDLFDFNGWNLRSKFLCSVFIQKNEAD